jgi:hypothetical protein
MSGLPSAWTETPNPRNHAAPGDRPPRPQMHCARCNVQQATDRKTAGATWQDHASCSAPGPALPYRRPGSAGTSSGP